MKVHRNILIILYLCFGSFYAKAGAGSHGGDAVVCYQNNEEGLKIVSEIAFDYNQGVAAFDFSKHPERKEKMVSIEVYDRWFVKKIGIGENKRERKAYSFSEDKSEFDWVEQIILELKEKSSWGNILWEVMKEDIPFQSNWAEVPGVAEVIDKGDGSLVTENCLVVQLASQKDSLVTLDENLYPLLSFEDKISILLHEFVYFYEIRYMGSQSSQLVRQSVSYLTSEDFFNDDTMQVNDQLMEIYRPYFNSAYVNKKISKHFSCKFRVGPKDVQAYCPGVVLDEKGKPIAFGPYLGEQTQIVLKEVPKDTNFFLGLGYGSGVWLYPSGEVKRIRGNIKTYESKEFESLAIRDYTVEFDKNGKVVRQSEGFVPKTFHKKVIFREGTLFNFFNSKKVNNILAYEKFELKYLHFEDGESKKLSVVPGGEQRIMIKNGTGISFHKNGVIQRAVVGDVKIMIQKRKFKSGDIISFNEQGKLLD